MQNEIYTFMKKSRRKWWTNEMLANTLGYSRMAVSKATGQMFTYGFLDREYKKLFGRRHSAYAYKLKVKK